MSDETKAAIVAIIWLSVFAVFCAEPSVIRALLVIFTTVIEVLYIKHDAEREELRKSRKRYADHADEAIRREMSIPKREKTDEEIIEEKYRYYIGE